MIAALATCLFVIYLYRTLNPTEASQSRRTPNAEEGTVSLTELTTRLTALEDRLRSLSNDPTPWRKPS